MATVITNECINCGACEPECPNTAIYQGGAEWDLDGVKQPALAADIFFIVAEKCTECVGFHDKEACAVACPVDCCVPDPNRPESEAALLERARKLHPERVFTQDFPSRFRTPGIAAAANEPKASAVMPPVEPVAPAPAKVEPPMEPARPPTPASAAPPPATATPAPAPPAESQPVATAPNKPQPAVKQGAPASEQRPAAAEPSSSGPAAEPEPKSTPAAAEKQEESPSALPNMDEWEIPVDCFRCQHSYTVRFKHFRSGVVLRCPSCRGSYVVTTTMHSQVHRRLREFHQQCRRELEAVRQAPPQERAAVESRQRQAVERFGVALKALRAEQKAPGVPHQRAGIFG